MIKILFLLFFASFSWAMVPPPCIDLLAEAGGKQIYTKLLSTNVEALKKTKINTTFPSPNMTGVEPQNWLSPDGEFTQQLQMRRKLFKKHPDRIFRVFPGHEATVEKAGKELLEKLAVELPKNYPEFYELKGRDLLNKKTGEVVHLDSNDAPSLVKAGLLVQDDLTISAKLEGGEFRLIGGFVATPTNWELKDFLGFSVHSIHADVLRYDERLRKTVQGLLERMAPGNIVGRNNWFLFQDPTLAQPPYHRSTHKFPWVNAKNVGNEVHLRSEWETISSLTGSGTILFTIRPRVWSMDFVKENAPEHLPNLAEGIFTHDREEYFAYQFASPLYKFLTGKRLPTARVETAKAEAKIRKAEERKKAKAAKAKALPNALEPMPPPEIK